MEEDEQFNPRSGKEEANTHAFASSANPLQTHPKGYRGGSGEEEPIRVHIFPARRDTNTSHHLEKWQMETCIFPAAGVLFQVKALLLDSYAERWEGDSQKSEAHISYRHTCSFLWAYQA